LNTQEITPKPVGVRILRGILIGLGLVLLNLIFILGPYVGLWGIIVAFVASGSAFILSGLTMITAYLFTLPLNISVPALFIDHPIMMVLSAGVFIGGGGILLSSSLWVSKYLVIVTGKYIKWQVKLVRGDNDEQII